MGWLALLLAFAVAAGAFADFWLGDSGDERIRARMANFYVAVGRGDWSLLYRLPAQALLRFLERVLGAKVFSPRYIGRVLALSASMTLLFLLTAWLSSYIHVAATEQRCQVPSFMWFVAVFPYMGRFVFYAIGINALFDYLAWTASISGLKAISRSGGSSAGAHLLAFVILGGAIVWFMYAVYLPLTIAVEARNFGRPFSTADYLQILRANLGNLSSFFAAPHYILSLRCPASSPDNSMIYVSFINTMQILVTETLIPTVLLLVSTIAGLTMYATQSFTRAPLMRFLEKLELWPKHVLATATGAVAVLAGLVGAIIAFRKG